MSRRRSGSVRFDPYYKVQWWDEQRLAWHDVQYSFASEETARVGALLRLPKPGLRWRLMRVTMEGRTPLPEEPSCGVCGGNGTTTNGDGDCCWEEPCWACTPAAPVELWPSL